MTTKTIDDVQQNLWRLGLKLKGVGEILESYNLDSTPFDSEDCRIGVGFLIKDFGNEVLAASEAIQISKPAQPKRKRRSK